MTQGKHLHVVSKIHITKEIIEELWIEGKPRLLCKIERMLKCRNIISNVDTLEHLPSMVKVSMDRLARLERGVELRKNRVRSGFQGRMHK